MKIGIAILGAGRWGKHFVRHFLRHPQARLVAIVDSNPERLQACKQSFGLDDREIELAANWQDVRTLESIEAVAIATPASTHYALIADALNLGYHILAEKPLTLDPSQAVALARLASKQRRQLFVDHTYLFHPAVEAGLPILQSGQLGDLRYGYASRTHLGPVRQDVDALWDLAIHDISIFNYWLSAIPIQVEAQGAVWLQGDRGLSDLIWAKLRYASGFEAVLHLCWLNPDKQRRLAVVGSEGSLVFDELSAEAPLTLYRGVLEARGRDFSPHNQSQEFIAIPPSEPLRRVCDRFLAVLNGNEPCPLSSGWMGSQLVQILACLSQSLRENGTIVAVPVLTID
jgi:predicted dehydrogenase